MGVMTVTARSAAAKRTEAENGGAGSAARRRLAPAERTPQLLAAALEEFAERGYAGASMAATAARAGVAKGLIYHYFPGKADLFKAVVRSCIQPVFSEAERLIAAFQGPRTELLRGLLELAYNRVAAEKRERVLFKLILAEADRFPELAAFYHAEVFSRALALVGSVLRAGVASGGSQRRRGGAACDEPLAGAAAAAPRGGRTSEGRLWSGMGPPKLLALAYWLSGRQLNAIWSCLPMG